MIQNCITENSVFGVVLIRQGVEALGPLAEPFMVGCTARINHIEYLPENRMNILVIGDERFGIHSLDRDKPFLMGDVEAQPIELPQTLKVVRGVKHLSPLVKSYLTSIEKLAEDEEKIELSRLVLPEEPLQILYMAAALLQIPTIEKQYLLESHTAGQLLEEVARLYRREISIFEQTSQVSPEHANHAAWLN